MGATRVTVTKSAAGTGVTAFKGDKAAVVRLFPNGRALVSLDGNRGMITLEADEYRFSN